LLSLLGWREERAQPTRVTDGLRPVLFLDEVCGQLGEIEVDIAVAVHLRNDVDVHGLRPFVEVVDNVHAISLVLDLRQVIGRPDVERLSGVHRTDVSGAKHDVLSFLLGIHRTVAKALRELERSPLRAVRVR